MFFHFLFAFICTTFVLCQKDQLDDLPEEILRAIEMGVDGRQLSNLEKIRLIENYHNQLAYARLEAIGMQNQEEIESDSESKSVQMVNATEHIDTMVNKINSTEHTGTMANKVELKEIELELMHELALLDAKSRQRLLSEYFHHQLGHRAEEEESEYYDNSMPLLRSWTYEIVNTNETTDTDSVYSAGQSTMKNMTTEPRENYVGAAELFMRLIEPDRSLRSQSKSAQTLGEISSRRPFVSNVHSFRRQEQANPNRATQMLKRAEVQGQKSANSNRRVKLPKKPQLQTKKNLQFSRIFRQRPLIVPINKVGTESVKIQQLPGFGQLASQLLSKFVHGLTIDRSRARKAAFKELEKQQGSSDWLVPYYDD